MCCNAERSCTIAWLRWAPSCKCASCATSLRIPRAVLPLATLPTRRYWERNGKGQPCRDVKGVIQPRRWSLLSIAGRTIPCGQGQGRWRRDRRPRRQGPIRQPCVHTVCCAPHRGTRAPDPEALCSQFFLPIGRRARSCPSTGTRRCTGGHSSRSRRQRRNHRRPQQDPPCLSRLRQNRPRQ